jgi:hypothetical protein
MLFGSQIRFVRWAISIALVTTTICLRTIAGGITSEEIFERRIMPIFRSPNPSSCTECHLAGVDLKNYILPSHEKTFLSLRDQGLINMDNPAESKILRLISMKPSDGASLLTAKVRSLELEAFTEWIKTSAQDPKLRHAAKATPTEIAKPSRPAEVIQHGRVDRLLVSFEENIWSQRFRCLGCHSAKGSENAKLVAENGDQVSWMRDSPGETMRYLLETENINIKQPDRSRLLLKPLNEIKHGGGQKMLPGDMTYKAFRTFLDDYARTINDGYASANELPKSTTGPMTFGTEIWVKLTNTPADWAEKLLQIQIFAWDEQNKRWESDPVAVSDRAVWGKGKLWQHNLVLMASKESERARRWSADPKLSPGRYLLKVQVDKDDRLKMDWTSKLDERDVVGTAVVESKWPKGYGQMTVLDANRLSL